MKTLAILTFATIVTSCSFLTTPQDPAKDTTKVSVDTIYIVVPDTLKTDTIK